MSYTDNVENFLVSLDSFYENVPAEDLELLVGPVLERIRSQPGSPLSGSPLGTQRFFPEYKKKEACVFFWRNVISNGEIRFQRNIAAPSEKQQ